LFVADTLYIVSVNEASRINNVDLSMHGREISFVAWKVCVCVGLRVYVCVFVGV